MSSRQRIKTAKPSRRRDTQRLAMEARILAAPDNTAGKQADAPNPEPMPLTLPDRIKVPTRPAIGSSFKVDGLAFACIGQRRIKAGRDGLQSLWTATGDKAPISLALPLHGGRFTVAQLQARIEAQNPPPSKHCPINPESIKPGYIPPKSVTYVACAAPQRRYAGP